MADFNIAVQKVLSHEGGYTPGLAGDPGGATNFGISATNHPGVDIKNLTRDAAIAIYKSDYWDTWMEDLDDQSLANCVLDSAVNQGVGGMTRIRNQAGLQGKLTLAHFQLQRLLAYTATNKPQFYHAWFARTLDCS